MRAQTQCLCQTWLDSRTSSKRDGNTCCTAHAHTTCAIAGTRRWDNAVIEVSRTWSPASSLYCACSSMQPWSAMTTFEARSFWRPRLWHSAFWPVPTGAEASIVSVVKFGHRLLRSRQKVWQRWSATGYDAGLISASDIPRLDPCVRHLAIRGVCVCVRVIGFKMFQAAWMLIGSQHVSCQCFTVCTVLQETAQAFVVHMPAWQPHPCA